MARIYQTDTVQTIEDIVSWYDDQCEALRDFKNKIVNALLNSIPISITKFNGKTLEELEEYFDKSADELEHLFCFHLISCVEGNLMDDFSTRINIKEKSDLGKSLFAVFKAKGDRPRLKEDIIKSWIHNIPGCRNIFNQFMELLRYRHWIAHGRYWSIRLSGAQYFGRDRGQEFSFNETWTIATSIVQIVENN